MLNGYQGQAHAERGVRFLKDPQFLAASLYLKKPERIMALLMVMTVCLLVYAALEYRIRKALKDHTTTFPNHKDQPVQNPTARWVFQYFGGIHVLRIPGQWDLLVVNLTEQHQQLLELLGKSYTRLYRGIFMQMNEAMRNVGIRMLGCKIVQPNILIPVLSGMSKGARMQAVLRGGRLLGVKS